MKKIVLLAGVAVVVVIGGAYFSYSMINRETVVQNVETKPSSQKDPIATSSPQIKS
ncbi:MAG: hypothetical protein HYV77_01390, partial [Candidatus Wildermuthbacteria bacterium]|nr:hypothetical protein [Candidatus Wildermuthbacteria bacterium]